MLDENKLKMKGSIVIRDKETNEILVAKDNQINYENMSLALARSLGNKDPGPVFEMSFGNGGSSIDALGNITYLTPNTVGQNVTLYNQTFAKVVDDNSPSNLDPVENNMAVEHEDTKFFTDLVVTATLGYGEPSDQQAFDTSSSFTGDYVFDELGLTTSDDLLITHVIFHPVQKSLNRVIEVIYTLRITIA